MYINRTKEEIDSSEAYIQHDICLGGEIFSSLPTDIKAHDDKIYRLGRYRYVEAAYFEELTRVNSKAGKVASFEFSPPQKSPSVNGDKSKTLTETERKEVIKLADDKGGPLKTFIDFLFGGTKKTPDKKIEAKKNGSSKPKVKTSPKATERLEDDKALSELDEAERRWQ